MTTALENSRRKAWALAPALHRRGMDVDDLLALPYSSRDRKAVTVTRFCRLAYQEAGVELQPPHGPGSETWQLVRDLLSWMAANPAADRVPPVDMVDDRTNWMPVEDECPAVVADTTSTTTTSTDAASPCNAWTLAAPATSVKAVSAAGDFPRHEGAACTGCGTWHRRYGHLGEGALCPACRTVALGVAS